jgi:cytoskeletal protein CcmA (bactofilin family)
MIGRAINFIKKFFNNKSNQKEVFVDFNITLTKVDDNYISSTSVILDEKLSGNIYSLREVCLTPNAELLGNIISRTSNIHGKIIGDIICYDSAIIKSSAILNGNVRAKSMVIEHSSNINGFISINDNLDEDELIDKVEKQFHIKSKEHINNITNQILKTSEVEKHLPIELSSQIEISGKINENVNLILSDDQGESAITDHDNNMKRNIIRWY